MNRLNRRLTIPRRRIQALSYLFCGLCIFFGVYSVQAAYITYHGEATTDFGVGYGNVLETLSLQTTGGADSESGSVLWDGSADVLSGDATPQSQTVTAAQLTAMGFDEYNLIVVLNLSQTGSHPELDVHAFTMRFYTSLDASSYFDAVYDISDSRNTASSLALTPQAGMGVGQAGHVFRIHFEGSEAQDFFADDNHRIGSLVLTPMDNEANDGPEILYISDSDVIEVPEPATLMVLIVSGLVAFGGRLLRKRRLV